MKIIIPWKKRITNREQIILEDQLGKTLVNLPPRTEFVDDLYKKLINAPRFTEQSNFHPKFGYFLIGIVGVMSSLIILITGIRTFITFFGGIGLIKEMKKSPVILNS